MHNDVYVNTVVSRVQSVQITIFGGKKVGAKKIYFDQGSSITITEEMHQAIQNDSGREHLKGLDAKLTFLTSSPGAPLKPYEIQIGCIRGFGLPLRELKNFGKFEKVRR